MSLIALVEAFFIEFYPASAGDFKYKIIRLFDFKPISSNLKQLDIEYSTPWNTNLQCLLVISSLSRRIYKESLGSTSTSLTILNPILHTNLTIFVINKYF